MPKVSVVVPNYNHAPYLKQRLDSIFNQTFQNFEVILLDDCSTDNSVEILSEYAKNPKVSHFIINEKNSGSTFKQWQKGIELSKGEYIWIAESDDWADDRFLETLYNVLKENQDCSMTYCQSFQTNEQGKVLSTMEYWTNDLKPKLWKASFKIQGSELIKYILIKNIIPNVSAVLFKKSSLKALPKEIFGLTLTGDKLLYVSILKNTSICFINKSLNYFRTQTSSVRNKTKKANLIFENYVFLEYLLKNCNLSEKSVFKNKLFIIETTKVLGSKNTSKKEAQKIKAQIKKTSKWIYLYIKLRLLAYRIG